MSRSIQKAEEGSKGSKRVQEGAGGPVQGIKGSRRSRKVQEVPGESGKVNEDPGRSMSVRKVYRRIQNGPGGYSGSMGSMKIHFSEWDAGGLYICFIYH